MAPSMAKKNRDGLAYLPIEGRLDVLCYRLSESAVRMVEHKIGIAGLWDVIKDDVELIVNQHVGQSPAINGTFAFEIVKRILHTQRTQGGM